jgi:holin-like protein
MIGQTQECRSDIRPGVHTVHRIVVQSRYFLRYQRVAQVAVVLALWGVGEAVVRGLDLPIPGGIVGLGLLLALLSSGRLPARFVRGGANWLIADMLLFFVPAVMAARDHRELLGSVGVKLGIVIVVSTLCVMAGTAWLVALSQAWSVRGRPELRHDVA